eukprot:SM000057S18443  [mRNA]  locus=s57:616797:622218:- [translate_table: standard]
MAAAAVAVPSPTPPPSLIGGRSARWRCRNLAGTAVVVAPTLRARPCHVHRASRMQVEAPADPRDWQGSKDTHKTPPRVFYSKKMRAMVREALDNPVGSDPLRLKLQAIKAGKANPKVLMAFDDVSIPLPPMRRPDIRQLILERAEQICVEEGITDITFICSIALHRYIRPDEFLHICGPKLFKKYHPHRMRNYNAVDEYDSTQLGYTRHGEEVKVCSAFAEADLLIYANVNYVSMDGGYKSYATGLVHYKSLQHNHDSKTLRATRSLYDPPNSAMHKSFYRIGRMMQKHTDVFHVETVLDEQLFPFYTVFVQDLIRDMSPINKFLMYATVVSLKFVPLWLRMRIFWFTRGPFGLLQAVAGETQAVHERTLARIYIDKVIDVQGQSDIVIMGPTCIGPYTKDMYLNPLLVNTYALGYYYNMYIDGVPLLKEGGCLIVVNEMHYKWSSPGHDSYQKMFEEVIKIAPGLDEFEAYQEEYVNSKELNDIYRAGKGPAGVHGFYMYTWAAHGMDKIGKVFVVGATDPRGPEILRWQTCPSVIDAVKKAREFLNKEDATVSYFRCPPVGYLRVHKDSRDNAPELVSNTATST